MVSDPVHQCKNNADPPPHSCSSAPRPGRAQVIWLWCFSFLCSFNTYRRSNVVLQRERILDFRPFSRTSLTVQARMGRLKVLPHAPTLDPALLSWLLQQCSSEANWVCMAGVEGSCLETHLWMGHLSFYVLHLGWASTDAAGLFIKFSMSRVHIPVPTLVNSFSLGTNI